MSAERMNMTMEKTCKKKRHYNIAYPIDVYAKYVFRRASQCTSLLW
jgi:hypothetical protein